MGAKLPSTWTASTLGAVALGILSGGTPSTKNEAFWRGSVPWITSKWINSRLYLDSGEKFISDDAVRQSATTVVPRNNLIFATRVGVGKVAVNRLDLAINQDLAGVLIDSSRYDIRFIAYQLRSERVQNMVASHRRGATIQGITRDNLKGLEINLPPLSEQRKIAGVLGVVQRAMEQQERLLTLTAELKKALMHQLFTAGLRGEPQKQTEIGPVPEGWEVVRLQTLLREPLKNGHSAKASNIDYGIRTLTLTAVTKRDFSIENTKLTVADPYRVRDMWLQNGDILIERANTFEYVGLAALYEGPNDFAIYPDLMIRVRVDEKKIKPRFLAEYLLTAYCRKYFQKQARSTAGNFPKIDQGAVENLAVPLPPVLEQGQISGLLADVDRKEAIHRRKNAALNDLFRTLLHQLMRAQLRVHDLDLDLLECDDMSPHAMILKAK
jgi:type I restriction enzyme S subunit